MKGTQPRPGPSGGRALEYLLLLGAALAGLAFLSVRRWELDNFQTHFENAAARRAAAVRGTLGEASRDLEAIRAFIEASGPPTSRSFAAFTGPLRFRSGFTAAFEWIPRVRSADRARAERDCGQGEGTDVRIRAWRPGDGLVRSPPRDEYFPVCRVEPLAGNAAVLGFDLASEPERRAALERARATGRLAATGPIHLVQERGDEVGVLLFLPVHLPGAPTGPEEARRTELAGFVLGVYRARPLLEAAVGDLRPEAIDLDLEDATVSGPPRLLALLRSAPGGRAGAGGSGSPEGALAATAEWEVGGRRWRLVAAPAGAALASASTWRPGASAAAILAFATMAAGLALLERRVRTASLLHAHEMLRASQALERATEARRLAEAQPHRAKRLAAVGTLAGGFAHEINNPLSVVVASLEFALDSRLAPAPAEAGTALRDALVSALRIRDIVAALRKVAVGEGGASEATELRAAVEAAVERARPAAPCVTDPVPEHGGALRIAASQEAVVQLLAPILVNAAQATGNRGDPIRIRAAPDGDRPGFAVVEVADAGEGIPPELLPRVFEPFFTTRPHGAGAGLGLAVSLGIARALGGDISVESAPGVGSTFRVLLPVARSSVEA